MANPVLVHRTRGEVIESFHTGVICVVNESNDIIYSLGDIDQICYPRSAMKYFQHLPLLTSGAYKQLGLNLEQLALMCASHNGEPVHTAAAQELLDTLGLNKDNLQCGVQDPNLRKHQLELCSKGEQPTQLHNNCSGKHAGFLAYCKAHNLPNHNYIDPSHPLQKIIKETVAMFYQCNPNTMLTGMDGCSAPIFSATVKQQAVGFKNLSTPNLIGDENLINACNTLLQAIAQYPYMIAGEKRYCTALIETTKGRIIGKTGADGVYSAVIPSLKIGISIKIDDGSMGPQYTAMQHLLRSLGLLTAEEAHELEAFRIHTTRNWNKNITGTVEPNSDWQIKAQF